MQITEVNHDEYKRLLPTVPHVFNSVEFSELNRGKASALHYLIFSDTKVRFGIILGEKADGLHSPFSAPFGGFSIRGRGSGRKCRVTGGSLCVIGNILSSRPNNAMPGKISTKPWPRILHSFPIATLNEPTT